VFPAVFIALATCRYVELCKSSVGVDALLRCTEWPDDFFLGNRFTSESPRKTDLADVMEWMATVDDLGSFYGAEVSYTSGDVPFHVLYRAVSLVLRLNNPDYQSWSESAPWFAKESAEK